MFYYLNGTITLLDANLAVVDCGGVGYACHTTNYTLARLQLGKPAKLFTYCNIKEDAFDIFGFFTREELNCFERLLGVTGVGPKAALAICKSGAPLFEYTPNQVKQAVVGYGGADKHQVMEMTRRILKMEKVARPDDAADAIAIALCHARSSTSLLAQKGYR